jgi:cell division protein FtsI (penicillin-binding protein 3)
VADEHGGRFKLPWTGPARRSPRRAQSASALDWRNTLRSRLLVCAVLLSLWTAAIEARLVYLQVIAHNDLMARANRQQLRTVAVAAKRGEIVDRNGHLFAYSVDSDTIAADPSSIDQPDDVAGRVCAALDGCDATQRRQMTERLRGKGQFAYLARQVSQEEAARVKSLKIDGVLFFKESRRYYPKKDLAASVLGYVGRDNAGLAGLESTFDKQIRGHEGRLLVQNDARRRVMATREERPATAGDSLELTIDEYLQHVVERELRAGVAENAAAGGTAVILNPQSGEILAMASWPTFNPNEYNASPVPDRRNRAIQDSYEPGSTFKVVTASAAIEEGLIGPDDAIDCSPGYLSFGPRRISDTHHYGVLPFIDVIAKSSNVGAIKVGMKLGRERLGRYISRFGFGQPVAPDFRGENGGLVWNPAQLDASALASVSMGYQVAVTPLQMAAAVSVVANGGEFVEPHVVRAVIRNGRREAVARKVVRRAISSETAATMTTIMEAVVERGTAKGFAQLEGFTVAGKTGTASKIVNNRYSKSDYNASFVGFVPSRKPVVTIVVVIDSPHAHGYYGASVSAPIFKKIAQATLQHLGVPRTVDPDGPVIVAKGGGDMGPTPVFAPKKSLDPSAPLGPVAPLGPGQMPDLRGLSLRAALRTLTQIGLTTRSEGSGLVLEQSLEPGAPIGDASGVVLKLGRLPATHAGGTRP